MASNKKPRDFRMRDLRGLSEAKNAEAFAKYKVQGSPTTTHNASDNEFMKEQEKTRLDSTTMTYMKAVIKCPDTMASSQKNDFPLNMFTQIFNLMAKKDPKNQAIALASLDSSDEEYTDKQMREDLFERTDTRFYPWFQDHVKRSARRSFTPEYFMMGLVEEISKYKKERGNGEDEDWPPVGKHLDEVISRAGNIYWYIYGLCGALVDVIPETSEDDGYDWYYADFREVLGPLCGAIKDYIAGGEDWAVLRPRVQAHVSRVLRHVAGGAVCPAEEAMRVNIAKIRGKKD